MKTDAILEKLSRLQQSLQEKGCVTPVCKFTLEGTNEMSGHVSYYPTKQFEDHTSKYFYGDSAEEILRLMQEYVITIKSISDRRKEQFTKAVAQAIELGRSAGIETDFLSPLEATMKKLSENALTHTASAEDQDNEFDPL